MGDPVKRKPALVQCICPKHGSTTWLHFDRELDDFCLLKGIKPVPDAGRRVLEGERMPDAVEPATVEVTWVGRGKRVHAVDRSRDLNETLCGWPFRNSEDANGRLITCVKCRHVLEEQ